MIAPLNNSGLALVLKPSSADRIVDVDEVARLASELQLVLRGTQTRGDRQFCERRYSDDLGRELLYREDHILGLRVLLFAGPDVLELHEKLGTALPHYTLDAAFSAAATADDAALAELAKIETLAPLCALLSYGQGEDFEHDAYTLLYHRLHDPSLAVRRAALTCAAYLVSPEVADILLLAAEDRDLAPEVSRQLALRAKMAVTLDYTVHLEQAEAERVAGRPLAALLALHIALALARRTGIRLHDMMRLRESILGELQRALADHAALGELPFGALQALLDLGRFHEVEEVVTALLDLGDETSFRLTLAQRVPVVAMLIEALRGRGRYDGAAELLTGELGQLQDALAREPDAQALKLAQRHLEALL